MPLLPVGQLRRRRVKKRPTYGEKFFRIRVLSPLELLANVFKKLATDPEKEARGSGLGLAIVKQIVDGHGGTVTAEWTHGTGATFRFALSTPRES